MKREDGEILGEEALRAAGVPWGRDWSAAGVIAALEPMVGEPRKDRIERVLAQRLRSVVTVLDGPYDPHNAAAVMRSCDAFGVQQLHVLTREPLLVSAAVAQGTQRWVDVTASTNPHELAGTLKARGFCLVIAHPEGRLVPADLARLARVAIVLGNEHEGVSPAMTELADDTVRIPMRGFVESLNLSVSAAILLEAATHDRPGDLSPELKQRLYARGLYHSLNRSQEILAALPAR